MIYASEREKMLERLESLTTDSKAQVDSGVKKPPLGLVVRLAETAFELSSLGHRMTTHPDVSDDEFAEAVGMLGYAGEMLIEAHRHCPALFPERDSEVN